MLFGSDCDGISLDAKRNCTETLPTIEWMAGKELSVSSSTNRTALFVNTVKLRKSDASGCVHVRFVVRE